MADLQKGRAALFVALAQARLGGLECIRGIAHGYGLRRLALRCWQTRCLPVTHFLASLLAS